MTNTPKSLIERALCHQGSIDVGAHSWACEEYCLLSDAGMNCAHAGLSDTIVTALAEAGFVIRPREPTDEMLIAGASVEGDHHDTPCCAGLIWRAMVAAALGEKT